MMVTHYEGQPLHYNGKSLCRAIITILWQIIMNVNLHDGQALQWSSLTMFNLYDGQLLQWSIFTKTNHHDG